MMVLNSMITWANLNLVQDEDGQDLVEYALVLVFISIAAIAALMALGPSISAIYTQITAALAG